ncbi:hypothetical protein KO02_23105 [Sphingobacterium sp. ML3W]|uniref:hypothetical protein n=1 Tax=Sphingobacterium sp. ML3W TaxID=1538644 RepID=UPI0004F5DB35|nr:hypothetical protein [Sphingobacterium sp. ML3W]AIM39253.1 hypothetical protein KO02_23105 [Sphingobacterium sp. ML3W]
MKEKLLLIINNLNKPYELNSSKPIISLAFLAFCIPVLGLFYLWIYNNKFGIDYYANFNLTDAVAVLYQKLMYIILIFLLFSFLPLSFMVITHLSPPKSTKGKPTVLLIFLYLLFGTFILWVLCDLLKFPIYQTIIILTFAFIGGLVYIFGHKITGNIILAGVLFAFMFVCAHVDAGYVKNIRPKYNVVLKQHSNLPILTEGDTSRYLIYKTKEHYFIKNDKENLVYKYSITGNEMVSFTPTKDK